MKRRILALLLCAVMAFGFVGCGSNRDELEKIADTQTKSSNPEMTLTLYVPSMTKVSEETRKAVEDALNAISVKKYNTKLKFFAYPEEEYVPIVLSQARSAMEEYITYLKTPEVDRGDRETSVDYSLYKNNADGAPVKVMDDMSQHPELVGAGFDIFVAFKADEDSPMYDPESPYYNPVAATKMFDMLYDQRVLEALTPRMINEYAILTSKSYPEFVERVTKADINTDTSTGAEPKPYAFGVPNSYLFGSYTYLIINKEAVAKGGYTQDYSYLNPENNPTNAAARREMLESTLQLVKNSEEAAGRKFVDDVSVTFESYDEYEQYTKDRKTFAIAEIKGDVALPQIITNPNYEIIEVGKQCDPETEYAQSVYCISRAYPRELAARGITESDRIDRCLDILVLIHDNEEFRNTLQYGVKGEHYTIGRDGVVHTSTSEYMMDPARVGNMWLLYPCSDEKIMSKTMRKLAEGNWALAKMQNNEMLGKEN